jgi:superfamily II RNA helicase
MEPKAQFLSLPSATLKNTDEMDTWLSQAREKLTKALEQGPIILR